MGSFFIGLTISLLAFLFLFLGFKELMEVIVGTPKALERGYKHLFSSVVKMVIGGVVALGFVVWLIFFSLPGPNLIVLGKAINEKYTKEHPQLDITGFSVSMPKDLAPDLCRVVVQTSDGKKQSFLVKFSPESREILSMEKEETFRDVYE